MPVHPSFARGLLLSQVIPAGQWLAGRGPRVTACCTDADTCQPGDLFVAIDDPELVPQQAFDTARRRGAVAVLAERAIPSALPQFLVDDVRASFGTLCHALASHPSQSLRTIGVTGTYGKTTTQHLLAAVLDASGEACVNLSAEDIQQRGPQYVAQQLAEAHAAGCSHALVEVSSHSLARHQLSGLMLDAAVITNIRSEHLAEHGSLANYQRIKARIVNYLKPAGFSVINIDDQASRRLSQDWDTPAITVSLHDDAELTATLLERYPSEQTFLIDAGNESMVVRTAIIGDDHLYNCLAATATALALGVEPATIVRGLEAVVTVPGRLERIECGQPYGVFIDASATPAALTNVLRTLRQVASGNLICLMGVGPRQSESDCAEIGRVLEQYSDRCVLTGRHLERKLSLRNAHEVLDGFDRPAQAHLMPNRAKAICWALSQARPGDIVVLAGGVESTGPDQVPLCDADVTRYWLQHVALPADCPWAPV